MYDAPKRNLPGCQLSFATPLKSVAEPHHFDTDPDPAFQSDAVPDITFHSHAGQDPTFNFDVDTDPDPDNITNFFSIFGTSKNDPLRLPHFHFDADSDPAFRFGADLDPDPVSQNNADPDPQHCL